jgi:hypothetical protein
MTAAAGNGLLLFGGEDHRIFLGCLNCGSFNATSVCNAFGEFGSVFQVNSIWNPFGPFGSPFQATSPWNMFSNSAPIIVNEAGQSCGYFSVNVFHHDRTRIGWLVEILDFYREHQDLNLTREKMCGR